MAKHHLKSPSLPRQNFWRGTFQIDNYRIILYNTAMNRLEACRRPNAFRNYFDLNKDNIRTQRELENFRENEIKSEKVDPA